MCVYHFNLDCPTVSDLGLGDGSIGDSQITASSNANGYPVSSVRLDTTQNFWHPKGTDTSPWLQVDFQEIVNIVIIKTQGAIEEESFIRTFSVSYGDDGTNFQDYQDEERTKVLCKGL